MSKAVASAVLTIIALILTFFVVEYPKFQAFNDGLLHVYFMDVGQGDGAIVKLPSKKIILIDGGPRRDFVEQISEKLPFTAEKIDLVIVSHSHADHINGLLEVLENYSVGCIVYDQVDESISETETEFRELIELQQIKIVETADLKPESADIEGCFEDVDAELDIYSVHQAKDLDHEYLEENENLESNMVLLKYKNFDALFTGDAELEAQTALLPLLSGNIEVIKAAHHGSDNGFYAPLIRKLAPDYAVFSVGEGNSYGHPDARVIEGYKGLGVKSLRTDHNGDIQIKTDGVKWNVSSEKP